MKIEPVLRVLERLGAPYALIGGYAVAARGFARSTIDLHLLTTDPRVLDPFTWSQPDVGEAWRQVLVIEP